MTQEQKLLQQKQRKQSNDKADAKLTQQMASLLTPIPQTKLFSFMQQLQQPRRPYDKPWLPQQCKPAQQTKVDLPQNSLQQKANLRQVIYYMYCW